MLIMPLANVSISLFNIYIQVLGTGKLDVCRIRRIKLANKGIPYFTIEYFTQDLIKLIIS